MESISSHDCMILYKITFPDHPSSPPIYRGVRVALYLVFCIVFCRSMFVLLSIFFSHFVVCPSIYGIWLPLWYLQTLLILLFVFFWPLCDLSFFDLRLLITFGIFKLFLSYCPFFVAIVWSVLFRFMASDYPFSIFKLFLSYCPFFCGHCMVCPFLIYGFWLPLWYLQTLLILSSVFVWQLCGMSFDLRLLITPLVSSNSSYPIVFSFGHCVVCPLSYGSWSPSFVSSSLSYITLQIRSGKCKVRHIHHSFNLRYLFLILSDKSYYITYVILLVDQSQGLYKNIKEVIKRHKAKKDRQYNCQKYFSTKLFIFFEAQTNAFLI